jgi:broad specificity phosphatase PhoE
VLLLLRHARTAVNAAGLLQGRGDRPLDEIGIEQARLAGKELRDRGPIARVVRSPALRAAQTLEAAGLADLPVEVDERWREIDFGAYDERPVRELVPHLGPTWRDDPEYTPPGGESLAAVGRRVDDAIADLRPAIEHETVLVVSHATPIKTAAVWALGGPITMVLRLRIGLASVTTIEVGSFGLLLAEFNREVWRPSPLPVPDPTTGSIDSSAGDAGAPSPVREDQGPAPDVTTRETDIR